ncbi:uncharacterized protein LOC116338232 [Contarinia nasturtii]|uniref:uncharacterized protein LOC116338232 n=1 Tax=Contarinia nasturtii TaxID=265458 RepID=UPI0012D4BC14|nr:uncharacterized protein LOC116338232 [Contarinia nasturtii]
MWTKNSDGNVLWSIPAKLTLLRLLKRNPEALNPTKRVNPKKAAAWQKVYDDLVKAGMPKTLTVIRVKKCWSRLQSTAKAHYDEQLRRYSRHGKLVPLSKVDDTTINLLNSINSIPNPKKEVKKEPIDTTEDVLVEEVEKPNARQLFLAEHMNPVVMLERIGNDNVTRGTRTNESLDANSLSAEYWTLMKKIAENELHLKQIQCKNEEERMKIEREIHQKNMFVMDLKIQVQQMQIDALRGQNVF